MECVNCARLLNSGRCHFQFGFLYQSYHFQEMVFKVLNLSILSLYVAAHFFSCDIGSPSSARSLIYSLNRLKYTELCNILGFRMAWFYFHGKFDQFSVCSHLGDVSVFVFVSIYFFEQKKYTRSASKIQWIANPKTTDPITFGLACRSSKHFNSFI